ncbi:prepilin-type N-terminal cleavage/methylation domain-containing protein [Sphingomonas sp. BIUV-7]|uniref:Prepilin-type N-terminal cleavage/methylation domain-containing protein n=1 Tax=Sphingomonas natans TaxID=3063330 RepID=A0ABT8Y5K3_9SPHN|nr:prepilin-type N-terminal cleavage/methylation domain-containing protein [Sphingomonas sp. BIUV-7]MDO6413603.1 prepilin-type N-terminal cleavage/methylation domain-containing protein [Sphingomonas sp. BIUV-7]
MTPVRPELVEGPSCLLLPGRRRRCFDKLSTNEDSGGASGEGGFSLVEMIVALALFALISLAAFALVETVLSVQQKTDKRLDRIAQLDRALYLVSADFGAISDGPFLMGTSVGLRRNASGGQALVGYAMLGDTLMRSRGLEPRALISGVESAVWRFHRPDGWQAVPTRPREAGRPDAVELSLRLAPRDGTPGGSVRRVILLPAMP